MTQCVVDNAAAVGPNRDNPSGFDRSNRSSRHGVNRVVTRCFRKLERANGAPKLAKLVWGAGHESVNLRGSQVGIECSRIEVDCRRLVAASCPGKPRRARPVTKAF